MQQNKKNVILKDYKKLCRLFDAGTIFVALDTETTSISPSTGKIMEVGAVKFNKDGIISTFQQLINPHTDLTDFIIQLTHITPTMLCNQPSINEILPSFLQFLSDSMIIAHNARFDMNFINAACRDCNYLETKNKIIDTVQFSKYIFPTLEHHKLEFLADHFKLNKGSSHRAFDDANCCRELFIKCIEETKRIKKL